MAYDDDDVYLRSCFVFDYYFKKNRVTISFNLTQSSYDLI